MIAYEQIPAECTWLATKAMLKIDVSIENDEGQSSPSQMFFVVIQIERSIYSNRTVSTSSLQKIGIY